MDRKMLSSYCVFTPNATGRQDPIQSERIDAFWANFSREKTGDKFWFVAPHFCRAQASAFTRICCAKNSLEFKYLKFDVNFAWWQPISVQQCGHWVTCVTLQPISVQPSNSVQCSPGWTAAWRRKWLLPFATLGALYLYIIIVYI